MILWSPDTLYNNMWIRRFCPYLTLGTRNQVFGKVSGTGWLLFNFKYGWCPAGHMQFLSPGSECEKNERTRRSPYMPLYVEILLSFGIKNSKADSSPIALWSAFCHFCWYIPCRPYCLGYWDMTIYRLYQLHVEFYEIT